MKPKRPLDVEPRWAWDLVEPTERGGALLVESRAEKNAPDGTTLFVASTDSPDRAMDVVKQNWKLAAFRSNPVILDNHNPTRVVGFAEEVSVPKTGDDAGKLMIRVRWDMDSPDPTIRNVGHQHLSGIRRAGSVGFRAGKKTRRDKLPPDSPYYQEPIELETWWGGTEKYAGTLYEAPELLEFSSATIPMNAEALQRTLTAINRAEEPEKPAEDAPAADEMAWLSDPEACERVIDALWPRALERIRALIAPDEEPSEEPVEEMAWRVLWTPRVLGLLRSNADARRILRAVIDTGPPAPAQLRGDGLDFLFNERS